MVDNLAEINETVAELGGMLIFENAGPRILDALRGTSLYVHADPRLTATGAGQILVERVTGIEPALSAWEADVLPLNYTRRPVRPYRKPPFAAVATVVAALGLCLLLTGCGKSSSSSGSSAARKASASTSAVPASSSSAPTPAASSSSTVPPPHPHVAARTVARLVTLMHAGTRTWDRTCQQVVATTAEVSYLNYHGVPVQQVHPRASRVGQFECTYARRTRNGRSLFRVYIRDSSSSDQPSIIEGDDIVTTHGVRLELLSDDTGDTDVSIGLNGDAAREFLFAVGARVTR